MKGGSGLLAGVVVVLWLVVYLVTQVFVQPPLPTRWTIVAGAVLSVALILGYPSVLRGPRAWRGSWRSLEPPAGEPESPSSTIALVGRRMPLRSGLTPEAAERTARLLRPLLGGDAVAVTDRDRVLTFVGPGHDHHLVGEAPSTDATQRVLSRNRSAVLSGPSELGCPKPECPLQTGVIAPLATSRGVVGTLKVYRLEAPPPSREHVEGMARILSLHLELAELDRERQLAADAKLDALRSQINPHFLFNVLNTIASKARTDPEEARQLLLRLSDFFRYSTRQEGQFADFGQEYFFVRTYLTLEQARFGDRLRVRYDVDPQVLGVQVPVLMIQPLVENAVKHGLAHKTGGGTLTLKARVDPLARATLVQVRDDGVGMDEATVARVLSTEGGRLGVHGNGHPTGGIGLRNISERLQAMFGERCSLDIRSKPGEGTTVELRLPLR